MNSGRRQIDETHARCAVAEVRRILTMPIPERDKLLRIAAATSSDMDHLHWRLRERIAAATIASGISAEQLFNMSRRHPDVVALRWKLWEELHVSMRMSYLEIAQLFGTTHSNVIVGVRKHMGYGRVRNTRS